MNFLDLFAGAGGLSEGFMMAGHEPVAHVEMDRDAALTLRTRLAFWHLREAGDLSPYRAYQRREISRDELYSLVPGDLPASVIQGAIGDDTMDGIFAEVDRRLGGRPLDMVIGGPPCQAYSMLNRSGIAADDPRKGLYKYYAMFLERYGPSMFVMENVPGVYSVDGGRVWRDILATLRGAGYAVGHGKLNAGDFGVPQDRRRVIVIGWRGKGPLRYPAFPAVRPDWTVADILADLPPLEPGETKSEYGPAPPSPYVARFLRGPGDQLTWHVCRGHGVMDRARFALVINEWLARRRRFKTREFPDGIKVGNGNRFETDISVVIPDCPYSRTVTANLAHRDDGFVHPDIGQLRGLSVREAARIQSFPDSYHFEGSMTSAFRQIGNAVPPLMARGIAERLAGYFNEKGELEVNLCLGNPILNGRMAAGTRSPAALQ
jgi:DNA (cytosine-5)-methyltransferase 1